MTDGTLSSASSVIRSSSTHRAARSRSAARLPVSSTTSCQSDTKHTALGKGEAQPCLHHTPSPHLAPFWSCRNERVSLSAAVAREWGLKPICVLLVPCA